MIGPRGFTKLPDAKDFRAATGPSDSRTELSAWGASGVFA